MLATDYMRVRMLFIFVQIEASLFSSSSPLPLSPSLSIWLHESTHLTHLLFHTSSEIYERVYLSIYLLVS